MKAKVTRPDGTTFEVEGTPEEVAEAIKALDHAPLQVSTPVIAPIVIPMTTPPSYYPPHPGYPYPWGGTADPLPTWPTVICQNTSDLSQGRFAC